jgi:hypothetical protein
MITCAMKQIAYRRANEPWGGATIRHDGFMVADKADAYAVAVGPTTSVFEDASYHTFAAAFDAVVAGIDNSAPKRGNANYIGVFHDDAKHTIDFNLVAVVDSTDEVDALYAAGNPIPGGAYHFATGDGYWPQGTPEMYL